VVFFFGLLLALLLLLFLDPVDVVVDLDDVDLLSSLLVQLLLVMVVVVAVVVAVVFAVVPLLLVLFVMDEGDVEVTVESRKEGTFNFVFV